MSIVAVPLVDRTPACMDEDPETWFLWAERLPQAIREEVGQKAVEICQDCPVRIACLMLAMETERSGSRYGIYGGLTPTERESLRKQWPDVNLVDWLRKVDRRGISVRFGPKTLKGGKYE